MSVLTSPYQEKLIAENQALVNVKPVSYTHLDVYKRHDILTEEKNGELVPSAVAGEYAKQFEEIMIDRKSVV